MNCSVIPNTYLPRLAGHLVALGLLTLTAFGCGGGSPVAPPAPDDSKSLADWQAEFPTLTPAQKSDYAALADRALVGDASRIELGKYRLQADLTTGEYSIEPVERTGQHVLDVTAALNSPACPGGQCVDFFLNRRDSRTGFTSYTVFIYNPSNNWVYDLRFIWTDLQDTDLNDDGTFDTSNDVTILNPGGWTSEFDDWEQANGPLPVMAVGVPDPTAFQIINDDTDPAWPVINPFNVLGVNFPDRSLPPDESSFGEVQATVLTNTINITFMVTASVVTPAGAPNLAFQRQDPFEYLKVEHQGLMDDNVSGRITIAAHPRDHQCDIGFPPPGDPDPTHLGVEFNSPFMYVTSPDDIQQFELVTGGCSPEYELQVGNDQGERAGKYVYYLRTHSGITNPVVQMQGWDLYWKGKITVVHDPSGGGGGNPSPQNTIAYVTTERGNRDIILDRVGGGFKTNLNSAAGDTLGQYEDTDPAFSLPYVYSGGPPPSATKRWVAWASNRPPAVGLSQNGKYRVYIWDLNPSGGLHSFGIRAVTGQLEDCLAPAWKPDNLAITCQCKDSTGRYELREYPVFIPTDDVTPPTIGPGTWLTTSAGDNTNPSYSRGGEYIAFDSTRVREDNPEIYVLRLSDRNVFRVTTNSRPDRDPVWASGTGFEQLIFQTKLTATWDIYVAEFAGAYVPGAVPTIKSVVTSNDGDDVAPAVSPDGRQLIWASNRGAADYEIWTGNAASGGGGEVRRTNDEIDQFRPAWGLDTSTS